MAQQNKARAADAYAKKRNLEPIRVLFGNPGAIVFEGAAMLVVGPFDSGVTDVKQAQTFVFDI